MKIIINSTSGVVDDRVKSVSTREDLTELNKEANKNHPVNKTMESYIFRNLKVPKPKSELKKAAYKFQFI